MEQLAAQIHNEIQSKPEYIDNRTFCDFPIRSICGVNIHLELEFQSLGANAKQCVIKIITFDVKYSGNSDTELFSHTLELIRPTVDFTLFTVEKITNYIKQMLEIIPKLRLNKLKAKLTQEEPIDTSYIELFKFENTELRYDICSVCHELCNTTTKCKHSICIECASKLDGYESDDEETEYDCPLCRTRFIYLCRN
jgi:hypothetical protein